MSSEKAPQIGRVAHASWLLFGGVFTGLTLAACAVGAWVALDGTGPIAEQTEYQEYSEYAARIEVTIESGDLRVIGGADQVSVERHYEYAEQRPVFTETWADGTLSINARCALSGLPMVRGDHCAIGYLLRVPSAVAIEVDIGKGSIRVEEIDGELRLATGVGDVEVHHARGPVWARSSAGSITGTGLQGPEADARTQFGDVSLGFDRPPGLAWAAADVGNVEVAVSRGDDKIASYRVRAETADGHTYVDVVSDPASLYQIIATTDHGDVFVRYATS